MAISRCTDAVDHAQVAGPTSTYPSTADEPNAPTSEKADVPENAEMPENAERLPLAHSNTLAAANAFVIAACTCDNVGYVCACAPYCAAAY